MKPNREGFTLLEVVVALVLMGTLVASALVSMSAYKRQMLFSKQRIVATRLADEMLARWYELNQGPPTFDRGQFESNGTWLWRTQPVGVRKIFGNDVTVIRFDLLGITAYDREPVLFASVELLQNQVLESTPRLASP